MRPQASPPSPASQPEVLERKNPLAGADVIEHLAKTPPRGGGWDARLPDQDACATREEERLDCRGFWEDVSDATIALSWPAPTLATR